MPVILQTRVKEMAEFWSENDSTIIRRAINYLYDEEYRKKAYGYQSGSITAAGRLERIQKNEQREAQLKTLRDMDKDQFLAFILETGYLKQDELDAEFNKHKHFFVEVDHAGSKDLYYQYFTPGGPMEYPQFYMSFDDVIKDLIKEKRI